MIVKEYFYNVECECCNALVDEALWDVDEDGAKEKVYDSDWKVLGEKHYCPKCWHYDENDNIVTADGNVWDEDTEELIKQDALTRGDKTNSVYFNTRASSDKESAFKEEIKKKYRLSETNAELITGRVGLALKEQRQEILKQCEVWLKQSLPDNIKVVDGDKAGTICKSFFISTFLMAMEGRVRKKKKED